MLPDAFNICAGPSYRREARRPRQDQVRTRHQDHIEDTCRKESRTKEGHAEEEGDTKEGISFRHVFLLGSLFIVALRVGISRREGVWFARYGCDFLRISLLVRVVRVYMMEGLCNCLYQGWVSSCCKTEWESCLDGGLLWVGEHGMGYYDDGGGVYLYHINDTKLNYTTSWKLHATRNSNLRLPEIMPCCGS